MSNGVRLIAHPAEFVLLCAAVALHPGVLLLCWLALVVALQSQPLPLLVAVVTLLLPLAHHFARYRTESLLNRARWLLFSLFILFSSATPGLTPPEPFDRLGLTVDGLQMAAEHVARLLVILAALALLHEYLGREGLVSGLYWLLAPLGKWCDLRRRLVVRLMLVFEAVETERLAWRQWLTPPQVWPSSLVLQAPAPSVAERWIIFALVGLLLSLMMEQI